MYCMKCGKDIDTALVCPFCGAEQGGADPFSDLGDLVLGANEGDLQEPLKETAVHRTYFSSLGDICLNGKHSVDTCIAGEQPGMRISNDPFRSMGNLDSSCGTQRDEGQDTTAREDIQLDEPSSLDDRWTTQAAQTSHGGKSGLSSGKIYVWKKWITIAAGCAIVAIFLFCWVIGSQNVSKNDSEQNIQSADIALENVLEAPILEVNIEGIETPAFLSSIESRNGYEIISFEKTLDGAIAILRVYAPDVYSVAKTLDSDNTYTNEDTLMTALDNAIKSAPIREKEVNLEYELTEDGYVPVLTAEFLDAYYGGIYQLRNEIIADAAEEEG